MKKTDLTITLLPKIPLPYSRLNDKYIMAIVLDSNQYSPQKIRDINNVRIFLQVLTLSDITSHDGQYILDYFLYKDKKIPQSYNSPYSWPKQVSPGEKSWALWRNALNLVCKVKYKLKQPLQQWLVTSSSPWQTFYSPSSNRIYKKVDHHLDSTRIRVVNISRLIARHD